MRQFKSQQADFEFPIIFYRIERGSIGILEIVWPQRWRKFANCLVWEACGKWFVGCQSQEFSMWGISEFFPNPVVRRWLRRFGPPICEISSGGWPYLGRLPFFIFLVHCQWLGNVIFIGYRQNEIWNDGFQNRTIWQISGKFPRKTCAKPKHGSIMVSGFLSDFCDLLSQNVLGYQGIWRMAWHKPCKTMIKVVFLWCMRHCSCTVLEKATCNWDLESRY